VVLLASVKLLPEPLTKPLSPLTEYCQVAPTSKPLTVIKPLLNANPIFDLQSTTINASINAPITTTVYDAQATNHDGGTIDEGITYSIKGTNADKFSITTNTGIH
jgi:hypothetical protein